ncbi:MAG: FKBP-type peptidyl-prolyl cis-trans isomerase [Mogibacterium sp.]|nr:FKBP-type peptidyl-prolyl cis-trans isomerase [Mogibacterium sp.]
MKIAVTHENGQIFQHFGHCEEFKVYTVEDGTVVSTAIVPTEGAGHEALAVFLVENGIDTLICGGMGAGAEAALKQARIEIFAGAEGSADEAVEACIKGELVSTGVNCDHHDNDEEGCGSSCGGCAGSCGGCGGGCGGGFQPPFDGPNVGKVVKVHYEGTLDDGSKFDSSYDRGEPLEFVCGAGMMILGFDEAVANMSEGEIVNVHLTADRAYGERSEQAVLTVEIKDLPGSETLEVGARVALQNPYGQPVPVTVTEKDDVHITFDANHELAGKELNFKIELVGIE